MKLGDIANEAFAGGPRPLDGVRVLAAEQMAALTAQGLAAGPSMTSAEVCADPHVAGRNMIVEMPRPDGGDPVFIPGNPIKMSRTAEGPETRVPWLGEHTDAVLAAELGLGPD